ncbi:MAG: glycosyl hydrolase, partial [Blastocatellia bacterium]
NDNMAKADVHLFRPEETYRTPGGGGRIPAGVPLGENPAGGVVVQYWLREKPKGEVTLEFLDAGGKLIKKFSSKAAETPGGGPGGEEGGGGGRFGGGAARATDNAGLNRFVWNLRHSDATSFPGLIMWAGSVTGPRVAPGSFQVRMSVDGKTMTEKFELKKDPRIETTPEQFAKQETLLLKIRDKLSDTHQAILDIRDARKQVNDTAARVKDHPNGKMVADAAKALAGKLTAIEEELYQTKNQSSQDPLNYPIRLNNKLAALAGSVGGSDNEPTAQALQVFEELNGRINAQLEKLKQVMATDLPAFNKAVRDADIPAVLVKGAGK